MSSRKNFVSLAVAILTLVAILAGCVSGATVRHDQPAPGPAPTGSPTASPSASPTASATPSPVATPVAIDSGRTNVFDLAQDATNIYYTLKVANNGFVLSVPKNSTGSATPIVLASGGDANTPWGVACDAGTTGFVYYTDNLPTPQGKVWRVPKPVSGAAAGPPEVLATGLSLPTFIRLNNVTGGDGLLYTCENVANDGRVLRFSTALLNQDRDAATFIQENGDAPPAYNLHLFSVNGVSQVWYTLMDFTLTTGANGQVRFKATTDAPGGITSATLVGTGLLNPTDLWLHQKTATAIDVLWTEYDASAGSVRRASTTDFSVRGTPVGVAVNSVPTLPPVSLKIDQGAGTAYVARNAQEANGGSIVGINLTTDVASDVLAAVGAVNYPFQFDSDVLLGMYVTEFNFTQGAGGLSTQPSRLMRLAAFPTFSGSSKRGVSMDRFDFRTR